MSDSAFSTADPARGHREHRALRSSPALSKPELPALSILSSLDEDDRRLLSDYGEFLPVQEDANLIEEGAQQDTLYFLISGLLHVTAEVEGKQTLLSRIEAGESIGEISVFDPGKASATVTARKPCQVWKAGRVDIEAFLSSYPEAGGRLLFGLLSVLSARLRHTTGKLTTQGQRIALRYLYQ